MTINEQNVLERRLKEYVSQLIKRLSENNKDIYSDEYKGDFLENLFDILPSVMTIVASCIINKEFMQDLQKIKADTKDIENAKTSKTLLENELQKVDNLITAANQKLETNEFNTDDEKSRVEASIAEYASKKNSVAKDLETVTSKISDLQSEIKSISKKVVDRKKYIIDNANTELKDLLFLRELAEREDIKFGIDDVKNLAFHLYIKDGSGELIDDIQRINTLIAQKHSIIDMADEIAEEICPTDMINGKEYDFAQDDPFKNFYDKFFKKLPEFDVSQYFKNINALITQDSLKETIKEPVVIDNDIVSITMRKSEYYIFLKLMNVVKIMSNSSVQPLKGTDFAKILRGVGAYEVPSDNNTGATSDTSNTDNINNAKSDVSNEKGATEAKSSPVGVPQGATTVDINADNDTDDTDNTDDTNDTKSTADNEVKDNANNGDDFFGSNTSTSDNAPDEKVFILCRKFHNKFIAKLNQNQLKYTIGVKTFAREWVKKADYNIQIINMLATVKVDVSQKAKLDEVIEKMTELAHKKGGN